MGVKTTVRALLVQVNSKSNSKSKSKCAVCTTIVQWHCTLAISTRAARRNMRPARFAGARNIEWREVPTRASEIPRDRKVILFCNTGSLSAQALFALRVAGYGNALVLQTGFIQCHGTAVCRVCRQQQPAEEGSASSGGRGVLNGRGLSHGCPQPDVAPTAVRSPSSCCLDGLDLLETSLRGLHGRPAGMLPKRLLCVLWSLALSELFIGFDEPEPRPGPPTCLPLLPQTLADEVYLPTRQRLLLRYKRRRIEPDGGLCAVTNSSSFSALGQGVCQPCTVRTGHHHTSQNK